ncbi:MAG: hypothetical protein V8T87_12375 [Victivallales bacterium]
MADHQDYIPICYGNREAANYATYDVNETYTGGIARYVGYGWNEKDFRGMQKKKSLYLCPGFSQRQRKRHGRILQQNQLRMEQELQL